MIKKNSESYSVFHAYRMLFFAKGFYYKEKTVVNSEV